MKSVIAFALSFTIAASTLMGADVLAQGRTVQPSQSVRPQPAPAAGAGIVDPSSVAGWAARVLAMVDGGQLAPLWDGASPVAQRAVKREDFVAAVQAARKPMGAPVGREWIAVRRQRGTGDGTLPAGEYASVELAVTAADKRVRLELVTFRLDEDGTWRFAGYVLR